MVSFSELKTVNKFLAFLLPAASPLYQTQRKSNSNKHARHTNTHQVTSMLTVLMPVKLCPSQIRSLASSAEADHEGTAVATDW